jgi:adenine-specific DNA-methyltransferase
MSKMAFDLLNTSQELQQRLEISTSSEHRKRCGQFFTPKSVCRFMAGLFSLQEVHFRLLDPGAGVGSLTAAVCEEFCRLKSPRQLEVHLFENDFKVIPWLETNMQLCSRSVEAAGHTMEYFIHASDFITEAGEEFSQSRDLFTGESSLGRFDGVIMNPPYFKIPRDSVHARLMDAIVHGQPNIYALFLALAAHLLRPGGELVAITPRSFCNGLYFRDFRSWFLKRMSLEHLHLFESRTETFRGAGVLQESIVTLSRRSDEQASFAKVSTSVGADIQKSAPCQVVPIAKIIDSVSHDYVVRIPTNGRDSETMDLVESLPMRFAETGLRISTGPVVLFRAEEFLIDEPHGRGAVPLLFPHNVKPFETVWPIRQRRKPCAFRNCAASRRLLLPTKNYVLLKRVTAKEERRRLTAGCFLGMQQSDDFVALENHLNYVYHGNRELSEDEVFGIAALLNSALFDRYFRLLSGSTQVNATELRTLRFPPLDAVETLGRHVRRLLPLSETALEDIVREALVSTHFAATVPVESLT